MPLIKSASKKALSKNIETEMRAHPEPSKRAQNIAIAYNIQRKAPKRKKMADGGMAESSEEQGMESIRKGMNKGVDANPAPSPKPSYSVPGMAEGGEIEDHDEHYESIADAILAKKRKAKKMAEGGEVVDLDNKEEPLGQYEHMNEEAADEDLYDDSQLSAQPEDSNEIGDDIDSDEHDMIDKIRAKIRSKRGM